MKMKRILSLIISTTMIIGAVPSTAMALEQPPEPVNASEEFFSKYLQINFSYTDTDWLEAVDSITVDGKKYQEADSSFTMSDEKFLASSGSYNIQIGNEYVDKNGGDNKIVIGADGYSDLSLNARKENANWEISILSNETGVESVEIEEENIQLKVGEKKELTLTVKPDNAANKKVKWSSSDDETVQVDERGKITAIKEGTATITAESEENSTIKDTCTVSVTADAKKTVSLTGDVFVDEYNDKYYSLIPNNDTEYVKGISEIKVNDVEWDKSASSALYGKDYYIDANNNRILFAAEGFHISNDTLENNDIITIINPAYKDTKLRVTINDGGFSVTGMAEGEKVSVESVKIKESEVSLKIGEIKSLKAEVLPEEAENKKLKWKSGNDEVVTVDSEGRIEAVGVGKATITAESEENSNIKDTCEVTVTEINKKVVTVSGEKISVGSLLPKYYYALMADDEKYINGINEIYVNGEKWEEKNSNYLLGKDYYIDKEEKRVLFAPDQYGQAPVLKNNDIIKIINIDYENVLLKATVIGDKFSVAAFTEGGDIEDEYKLHIRLAGTFEAALIGQKNYDGVTSASTSITVNKNSSAEVQAVILPKDEVPDENTEWKLLKDVTEVNGNSSKSYVEISPAGSGMVGVYNIMSSAVTLSGTPEKAGTYMIKVYVTDRNGRTAESNSLPFNIYTGEETLESRLKLEYCTQMQDGKYIYDMEPWKIKNFSDFTETVTVPNEIKAWYGSHTKGTYGELGKSAAFGTPTYQTLIIPEGCDLTLVNMKVLSGVKIVVRGSLSLTDTSIDGVIEVENGGKFSMNYDKYNGKFISGAMINGQVVLKDGAVLENAKIYSNTNYLDNDGETRKNAEPVVTASGNVEVNGSVYIAGDEAATGTSGQYGLEIKNGILSLADGAVLAVYGGGNSPLTSEGGNGVVLENGKITGNGTLIALGGSGWFGNGGDAVSGNGDISVKNVYLEGGNSIFSDNGKAGSAASAGVIVSSRSNSSLNDGKIINIGGNTDRPTYWNPPLGIPDMGNYEIPENGEKDETIQVEAITLNKSKITIDKGETYELKVQISPSNASNKTIKWSSDNENAVTVNNGIIKAVGKGEAVITAETSNGKTAKCDVTVINIDGLKGGSSYSLDEVKNGKKDKNTAEKKENVPVIGGMDKGVFDDVSISDSRYLAVKNVYEKGWMMGVGDRTFAPDDTLTRGMAAQILWNRAGKPEPVGICHFLDVTSDAWYAKAVAWAYENGITSGYSSTAYGPDDYVTTEQFTIMLDIANGKSPKPYQGGAPYATRGLVAVMISE